MIRDGYKIIIGSAIFIFIMTVYVLINPFNLIHIPSINDRAELSSSISTSIAIILGIIAIYIAATVEAAKFHVKRDIQKNIMTLTAVLPQSLQLADSFMKHAVISKDDDYIHFFEHDASIIRSIIYSPTGHAFRAWDSEFYKRLVGILHVMIGLKVFEENNNRKCVMALVGLLLDLIEMLESLTQNEIVAMADAFNEFNKNGDKFFNSYKITNGNDDNLKKLRDVVKNNWGPPTETEEI